jgi:hypothetical protein
MKKQPTEIEIQKVLKMLKESDPAKATRENALKAIEGMKTMAGKVIDRIDDDMKSGKVRIDKKGQVTRKTD